MDDFRDNSSVVRFTTVPERNGPRGSKVRQLGLRQELANIRYRPVARVDLQNRRADLFRFEPFSVMLLLSRRDIEQAPSGLANKALVQ